MGFISSRFSSPVRSVVTLIIVCELWRQVVVVNASLEESDSREHHTPFYESHNHINEHEHEHEHDHFHEDGLCDCNSQGPWRPLFKPSQADLPDPESLHHLANQLHDLHDSHENLHDLPNDLHPSLHPGERQAKKQNHMIHLHLIPHIYVPVVHPVAYSVYENNEHKPELDQNHNDFQSTESTLSTESQSQEQHDNFYHQNHLTLPNQNYGDTDQAHHDFSQHSHESGELQQNAHNAFFYPHSQHTDEHQYQVHEDSSRDPFYGNFATGSSDNTHVLPINKNINFNFFPAKKRFADRSRYNKRYLNLPANMLRMRVMRPPALGQKNTWLMNYPGVNPFPSKSMFDFKPYPIKEPLFDFKHFMKPNPLQSMIPATKFVHAPMIPVNKFLQTPVNQMLPASGILYPEIKKRMDVARKRTDETRKRTDETKKRTDETRKRTDEMKKETDKTTTKE